MRRGSPRRPCRGRGGGGWTVALLGAVAAAGVGCTAVPGGGPGGAPAPAGSGAGGGEAQGLVPPGYGTLRQDDVTLTLLSGDLQVKVTPLAEWVTRLTAPDTYRRLSGLARAHGGGTGEVASASAPALFLVSFFSRAPQTTFQPADLQVVSRGRRLRPADIRPVTPGWGVQRLGQEETQSAVYAFQGPVDLEQGFGVEYGPVRSTGAWDAILNLLEVERARARARAGSQGVEGGPEPGSDRG